MTYYIKISWSQSRLWNKYISKQTLFRRICLCSKYM